jgi:hypothetical protein
LSSIVFAFPTLVGRWAVRWWPHADATPAQVVAVRQNFDCEFAFFCIFLISKFVWRSDLFGVQIYCSARPTPD